MSKLLEDAKAADFVDHESPQAATRFAIAMALVKLKEEK